MARLLAILLLGILIHLGWNEPFRDRFQRLRKSILMPEVQPAAAQP